MTQLQENVLARPQCCPVCLMCNTSALRVPTLKGQWLYLAANGCKTYLNLNLNQWRALCQSIREANKVPSVPTVPNQPTVHTLGATVGPRCRRPLPLPCGSDSGSLGAQAIQAAAAAKQHPSLADKPSIGGDPCVF
jgi:hypothetical protein